MKPDSPLGLRFILGSAFMSWTLSWTLVLCCLLPSAGFGYLAYREYDDFYHNDTYCGYHGSCETTYPGLSTYESAHQAVKQEVAISVMGATLVASPLIIATYNAVRRQFKN